MLWGRGRSHGHSLDAVGAWPVPWDPSGRRGGVGGPLHPSGNSGVVFSLLCPGGRHARGPYPGPRVASVGVWTVPRAPSGLVAVCPVPWAPSGCRGGVTVPLGPIWPPWGRGRSCGPWVASVGAWTVPWVPSGLVEVWLVPWAPSGLCGGVTRLLGSVSAPLGRGCSPGPRVAAVGAFLSPGPQLATVGAWPVPRALSGCRGGVAGHLGPVRLLWGRGRSLGPSGRRGNVAGSLVLGGRHAGVAAPWASCCGRLCVAGPLGPVRLPCGRAQSPWPVWLRWKRGQSLGPVWLPWGRRRSPGPCGHRGVVEGSLGLVWPLCVPRPYPGHQVAAVGSWPVT